tara:strand:+ start:64 stop:2196 length:2133 start_codon:yes stop_codon:yes gene_type:complete
MKTIAIIRYPGSNCDNETFNYFNNIYDNCFYIWHNETNEKLLDNLQLLILPGGFAFGDRVYNKATEKYEISPGTMALNSPVSALITKAHQKKIPIFGICNGFQILTQMNLLPGKLVLNDCKSFTCKKLKCTIKYDDVQEEISLCIANSYGKYIKDNNNNNFDVSLTYENGEIAGIFDRKNKVFGMMPHPERNNHDFKHHLLKILLDDEKINNQLVFDKSINDLMFSEHISYKTTRKYLKKLHTKEDWVVQGPGENAGIVDIGSSEDGTEYCIALRIESHNHPTFINAFEGAATGVGGILRDIFTMGARPICILDFLRFGTDENSEYLFQNAIKGISYYGNCIGVANVGGDLYTHSSYDKNPLVNVACLGIVKKENIVYGNALDSNRLLIYVGSKTGNEGINGAAMASNTFDNKMDTKDFEDNVQKSDPFLEKLLLEACCEITENKLVEGMQDMGAGGLLCATVEVIKRGREKTNKNLGCNIFLDQVPTKHNMKKVNILISESQERMLIVCRKDKKDKIIDIFNKWDLESCVIGETTNNGNYDVYYEKEHLYTKHMNDFNDVNDYTNIEMCSIQKKNEICNKIKNMDYWEIYDSTIGNRTLKGPNKPGSYSVLDIPEVKKQLILTWGESFLECYSIMSSFENVKPLCMINCLNFGDPKNCLIDFRQTINDLTNYCKEYKIPIVGGNVSLYNSTGDKSIRPTPILLMMAITL